LINFGLAHWFWNGYICQNCVLTSDFTFLCMENVLNLFFICKLRKKIILHRVNTVKLVRTSLLVFTISCFGWRQKVKNKDTLAHASSSSLLNCSLSFSKFRMSLFWMFIWFCRIRYLFWYTSLWTRGYDHLVYFGFIIKLISRNIDVFIVLY
jgi:hypothetical protein